MLRVVSRAVWHTALWIALLSSRITNSPPNHSQELALRPIETLDETVLRARTTHLFPSGYLTLISIIQGLALGLLIQRIAALPAGAWNDFAWLQILSCFATMITIYYMYTWLVIFSRWTPSILDTAIPYGLGSIEAFEILSIGTDPGQWIVAQGAMWFGAIFAFMHSIYRIRADMYSSEAIFRRLRRLLWRLSFISSIATVMHLAFLLWWNGEMVIPTTATVIGAALMIFMSERTLIKNFRQHGIR